MITISLIVIAALLLTLFFFVPILHLVGWFLVGLVAGFLFKQFNKDVHGLTFLQTILLGVGGSLVGGAVCGLLGVELGVLGSILAAIGLLYLWVNGVKSK